MTDLQLIILSASIMKAGKTGTSAGAGDLIDDAQKLLFEGYKREIMHRDHVTPKDDCFICQMSKLLGDGRRWPGVRPS